MSDYKPDHGIPALTNPISSCVEARLYKEGYTCYSDPSKVHAMVGGGECGLICDDGTTEGEIPPTCFELWTDSVSLKCSIGDVTAPWSCGTKGHGRTASTEQRCVSAISDNCAGERDNLSVDAPLIFCKALAARQVEEHDDIRLDDDPAEFLANTLSCACGRISIGRHDPNIETVCNSTGCTDCIMDVSQTFFKSQSDDLLDSEESPALVIAESKDPTEGDNFKPEDTLWKGTLSHPTFMSPSELYRTAMLGGLDQSLVKLKDFVLCRDACAAHLVEKARELGIQNHFTGVLPPSVLQAPDQQLKARLAYIRSLADVAADEDSSGLKVHHLFESRPNKSRKRAASGVGEVEAPAAKKGCFVVPSDLLKFQADTAVSMIDNPSSFNPLQAAETFLNNLKVVTKKGENSKAATAKDNGDPPVHPPKPTRKQKNKVKNKTKTPHAEQQPTFDPNFNIPRNSRDGPNKTIPSLFSVGPSATKPPTSNSQAGPSQPPVQQGLSKPFAQASANNSRQMEPYMCGARQGREFCSYIIKPDYHSFCPRCDHFKRSSQNSYGPITRGNNSRARRGYRGRGSRGN